MGRRILTILGTGLLVTAISADAFAQRGRGGNDKKSQDTGETGGGGNTGGGSVPGVPEIALATGAGGLALLAGGLLVLRGRRRH